MDRKYIEKIKHHPTENDVEKGWKESYNQIVITLSKEHGSFINVENAVLKDEKGMEIMQYPEKDIVFPVLTNFVDFTLYYISEGNFLQNGTTFEIVLRQGNAQTRKKYLFVLQDEEWLEKTEE